MKAILTIGWTGQGLKAEPQVLYCGTDGEEAQFAVEAAQEDGKFTGLTLQTIHRSSRPLALHAPVTTRPKADQKADADRAKVAAIAKEKQDKIDRELAAKREALRPRNADGYLDGPTFRQFVDEGCDPADYPPKGYAAIQTGDWEKYLVDKAEAARVALEAEVTRLKQEADDALKLREIEVADKLAKEQAAAAALTTTSETNQQKETNAV